MDHLIKKLEQIEDLLKKAGPTMMPLQKPATMGTGMAISVPKPKMPGAGATKVPGMAPSSKKDPTKVAQQLKNPQIKIKEMLKFDHQGQWSIEKTEPEL